MLIPHQLSSSPSDPGVVREMVWFSVTDESVFLCSLIHASLLHHLHVLLKRLILRVFVHVLLLLSHLPFSVLTTPSLPSERLCIRLIPTTQTRLLGSPPVSPIG